MIELHPHLNPSKYRKEVKASMAAFRKTKEGEWYSMEAIEKWLHFYGEFYLELYHFYYKELWWYQFEDGTRGRLPDEIGSYEDVFCRLFEELEEVKRFYRYEPEAGKQVDLYEEARKNDKTLRIWVELNKEFYLDILDKYFGYSTIEPKKGMIFYLHEAWKIAVHPKYFKNCLDLAIILEHYNEMQYFEWEQPTQGTYMNNIY